ncbi:glycosyltransferase [Radiobacillus sp. PE A8.2]|uniref:glycosyltransferase n=1 Tax=Radiobacillus sp. PE A8.2 TaxID=3380349 RepID=UPI003890327F
MKILHVCLCGPVTDNWNYQDNLITKYHKKLGNEVTIITSNWIFNNSGNLALTNKNDYINNDDVRIIRLQMKGKNNFNNKFKRFKGIKKAIYCQSPDIVFIHGCQFIDIKYIVKYVKSNPHVKVYVDNHADVFNSGRNWLSKNLLHKVIWKKYAQMIEPYVKKYYGVLPARVDFLVDMYKLPKSKVELLVMGADDEKVEEAKKSNSKHAIRKNNGITENDFLIITGGKVDDNKTQIMLLMRAINEINNCNLKLIIFGSVSPKYEDEFNSLLSENVIYIGWINPKDTYKLFNAADLVVFPGLHSVFWEQVVGLGIPTVFKWMKGFTHIDLGGNCKFLYQDSVSEMKELIIDIKNNSKLYNNMKYVSETKGMEEFSYKKIALKSLS